MSYKQNTEFCYGAGKLTEAEIAPLLAEAKDALQAALESEKKNELRNLSICRQSSDLAEINEFAANIRANFETLVVLGTGGSSLCGHALTSFVQPQFNGCQAREGITRVIFMPNIDPFTWESLFSSINLEKTAFLAISKSGTSVETLVQLSYCLERTKHLDAKRHFFGITMKSESPLRSICETRGIKVYEHDPLIGGRFSLLSLVGLMPAVVAGLDPKALRAGVAEFLGNEAHLAAESAAIHVAYMRRNIWQNVMMTYPDRLEDFNVWYRQIWAESVGKNGTGSTPIKAIGTLDQHSQMQLYLGGRKDKIYSFIALKFKDNLRFPNDDKRLDYLNNKTLADVMNAEQQATVETLVKNGRPVRTIELGELDERHLGKLVAHLMLETIVTANLLGVNPYDQPAVEDGKVKTRELLRVS